MLYTIYLSAFKNIDRKMKPYYVMRSRGNNVVAPDQSDLDHYKSGALTWEGFKVNYLAKIMRPEAVEWMRRVSAEAASEDVVLIGVEKDAEHSHRTLLAEMMVNMFSGLLNLRYMGELK